MLPAHDVPDAALVHRPDEHGVLVAAMLSRPTPTTLHRGHRGEDGGESEALVEGAAAWPRRCAAPTPSALPRGGGRRRGGERDVTAVAVVR
jgi:hypothetical protein